MAAEKEKTSPLLCRLLVIVFEFCRYIGGVVGATNEEFKAFMEQQFGEVADAVVTRTFFFHLPSSVPFPLHCSQSSKASKNRKSVSYLRLCCNLRRCMGVFYVLFFPHFFPLPFDTSDPKKNALSETFSPSYVPAHSFSTICPFLAVFTCF